MRTRIKELRKNILHLSQEEFGSKIGLSKSNISNIEIGRIKLTDRVISDICNSFSVNDKWLRTGEGATFIQVPVSHEAYETFGNLMESSNISKKNFIIMLLKLVDELDNQTWDYIYKEFQTCVELTQKEREKDV